VSFKMREGGGMASKKESREEAERAVGSGRE